MIESFNNRFKQQIDNILDDAYIMGNYKQADIYNKKTGETISYDSSEEIKKKYKELFIDPILKFDIDKLNNGLSKWYDDIGHTYEQLESNDIFQYAIRNLSFDAFKNEGYEDIEDFYKVYSLDDFFAQNPQLTHPPVTSTQSSTQESVEGLNNENQSFKDIALSAMTAAQAKEAFVEANKEVKASVEGSIDNIENEGKAFGTIDENTVSNIERITTAIEELNRMLEALNKLMRSVFSNQGQMGWDINENGILNLGKALNSIRSASTGNYYGGSTSNYYGIEEDQLKDLLDQYTRSLQDAITGFSGLNNVDFNNLIIALSEIYELLEKITENLNSGISTTQFDSLAEKIATYNPRIQEYNNKLEEAKKLAEEVAQIEGQWDSFYGDENWKDTSKIKPTTSILLEDSKSMGYEGLGQDLYPFIDSQINSSNLIKKQKEQIENAKKIANELAGLYNEYSKLSIKKIKNGGFLDSFDSQKLAESSKRIQDLKKQLLDLRNSLKPSDRTDIDNVLKGVDEYEKKTKSSRAASLYDTLINSEGDIQKLLAKQAYTTNTDVGNTSGLTVNEQNELLRLTEKRKQIQDEINKLVSEQGVKTQAVKQKEAELLQTQRSFENTLNQSWRNKLGDELQKPYDVISDLEYKSGDARYVQSDAFDERISNLKKQADALRDSLKSLSYNDKDGIAKYNEQFLDLQRNISKAKDELKQLESKDVSKLMRNIAQFMERNSGISLQAKNELEAFYNELNDGSRMSKERLAEIANGFTRVQAEESKAGRTGMTFFDLISLRGKALIAQLATFTSFYDFIRYFKEGMQIVIQFDDALAEMQKVSSESLETLREFQTESFDLAGSIGSDALALQQSVAEFMRLGQSLEEATDSAMSANILLNVSEFTNASEASEALIAMSQAYQDLSNIEIIDVINKLGNDFPISTQGLATALQDGAASLTTAGNSFYEAAALVTAGNRITQDPSKVGKAMRTIALRLTGTEASKAELEEDGEEVEGMITNVSKLRDVIMQATKVKSNSFKGFDILKDNGAYKSTYEILLGIAEIYQEIVENDAKTGAKGANLLLETIAGKNRASIAASILQSPDMLKEAYAEAIDAEGSAEIENAKFIDSISGHLEKLKNAWQELWANVTTREFVNTIIDFGTAILKAVNNLGLLKTALVAISSLDILKFLLKGDGFTGSIVNSILQASDAKKSAISQMGKQLVEVTDGSSAGVKLTKEVADKLISEGSDKVLKYKLVKSMGEAGEEGAQSLFSNFISNATSQGLGKALAEGTTKATEGVEKLGQALWAVKGPILIVTAAIGALALTLKAIDVLNLDASETAKEAKEITSAFQESQATIREHKQTIDDLSTSYTELSKGVNTTTNANLTLSNEEYQQYLNTCNQIADLYPELVAGYDLQGNAILNLKGNVDALTESLIKEQTAAADTLVHGGLAEDQRTPWQRILHWGDDNSIQKDYQNKYKDYKALQKVRNQFSNRFTTLDDYKKYREELIDASGQGDSEAGKLLHQLYVLSGNRVVETNEQLEELLRNVSEQTTPEGFDEAIKNAQALVRANLTLDKTYQDLMYRSDADTQKYASNLFTNAVNNLSPERYNELLNQKDGMKQYANNLANGINSVLSGVNSDKFIDIIKSIEEYGTGEGILASANIKDFGKIANSYKQAFVDAFADSEIDGAELFENIFNDQGVSNLEDRFNEILKTTAFTAFSPELKNEASKVFYSLTKDQAEAYLEAWKGAESLNDVNQRYAQNLRVLSARTYEAVVNIEDETNAINTLTSALSSSASGNGLSEEEIGNITSLFQDVVDFDENKLLENTANGVHLNVEELERLNKERAEINLKKQGKELDKYTKELHESEEALKTLKQEYDAGARSLEDYQNAYNQEDNIRQGIENKINLLRREMAQYSALTSAYNQYVQAQSSANENARYENIGSGYETTKDLIERGWIGQDDVRAYLNMFTDEDMMTASVDKLYAVWDGLDDKINSAGYSLKDFFTYDDNGKSTSDGIFNFLDTVKQAAKDSGISDAILEQFVSVDKETGAYSFDFDILGGDQKVADMLGVDLSLLQAIIQAAKDAGFEVQMTNALPGLQSLTENLRNMRSEVKKLGGDVDKYDFHVLSIDVDSKEYDTTLKSISGAIKELKEANLDDPLNYAYYNQVNSELETLIGTKARATVDKGWEDTNVDQVVPKYQGLVSLLDEMYYQQERLKATNAFNEEYKLDVDTTGVQKSLDKVQDDLMQYIDELSYADAQELGLDVTPDFDGFTAEEKWDAVKEQIKKQGGISIPVDLESPTGDPTKGIDSQKITIDIQFSVDGKTLVLKDITSVEQAAEKVPEQVDTTLSTSGNGPSQVSTYSRDINDLPKVSSTQFKNNAKSEKKEVDDYNNSLTKTTGTRIVNFVAGGLSVLSSTVTNALNNITKNPRTITFQSKVIPPAGSGGGGRTFQLYNGTAHALGTAYARGTSGNWGVPEDQDALTGELGEELVVRNGHFFTVGSESAEMVHLQKGDIVFNADQTKQIFEKGRIINGSRRGRAHADGTAYSAGSGGRRRTNAVVANSKTSNNSSSNNNNKKSSNNKSSNNNSNDPEKMDWIAIAIERIEQQIDELNDVVDSVYRSWSDRNKALTKEIKAVSDEIAIQQAGYKRYLKEAESIGLSEAYAKKVREGTIDIQKITDEKLKKKIDEYQQWCVLRPLIW